MVYEGFAYVDRHGLMAGSRGAAGPIAVNPDFATYVCGSIDRAPWLEQYDMRHDGAIGVDDLKTAAYQNAGAAPIDRDRAALDLNCREFGVATLVDEVEWKLQDAVLQPARAEDRAARLAKIDALEKEALARFDKMQQSTKSIFIKSKTRSAIVEMALRARNIANGATDEPFGIGVKLMPREGSLDALTVLQVHPAGGEAGSGLQRGDAITHVDGKPIRALSSDGTLDGLLDPATQLMRGMSGPRDSHVVLTVEKPNGKTVTLSLARNIWSARRLSVTRTTPLIDGTEKQQPREP